MLNKLLLISLQTKICSFKYSDVLSDDTDTNMELISNSSDTVSAHIVIVDVSIDIIVNSIYTIYALGLCPA
jgi:hypothetical protein